VQRTVAGSVQAASPGETPWHDRSKSALSSSSSSIHTTHPASPFYYRDRDDHWYEHNRGRDRHQRRDRDDEIVPTPTLIWAAIRF